MSLNFLRVAGAAVLLLSVAARAAPAFAGADVDGPISNAVVARILTSCKQSIDSCQQQFERSEDTGAQVYIDNSFSILGIFKSTNLTFWGLASHIHYTEIVLGDIEYQVGVGYVVYAKQLDAKPSGSGLIGGVAINGSADVGRTRFSASIIGLAPDAASAPGTNCDTSNIAVDQAVLCALDVQPTVTQEYFKAAVDRLESAYANWGKNAPENSGAASALCPQIINYRTAKDHISADKITLSDEQFKQRGWLLSQLSSICHNNRPNAHVSYTNGKPSLNLGVDSAADGLNQSVIGVSYFRNRWYLADTPLRSTGELYDPASDHSSEIYFDGLTSAAALPSVISIFVTLSGSAQNHRLHTILRCSGGAKPTMIKFNPDTDSSAFTTLVSSIRKEVDSDANTCPGAPTSISSRG